MKNLKKSKKKNNEKHVGIIIILAVVLCVIIPSVYLHITDLVYKNKYPEMYLTRDYLSTINEGENICQSMLLNSESNKNIRYWQQYGIEIEDEDNLYKSLTVYSGDNIINNEYTVSYKQNNEKSIISKGTNFLFLEDSTVKYFFDVKNGKEYPYSYVVTYNFKTHEYSEKRTENYPKDDKDEFNSAEKVLANSIINNFTSKINQCLK